LKCDYGRLEATDFTKIYSNYIQGFIRRHIPLKK
jgi:hypothetical protein